jgi:Sulfotransferase family
LHCDCVNFGDSIIARAKESGLFAEFFRLEGAYNTWVPNWPRLGQRLIFLISQPRAGSTLLQKVLGSHSAIHTLSEPWLALHPLYGLRASGIAADYSAKLARTGVQDFLDHLPEGEAAYWEAVRLMLGHLYRRALEESGKRFFLDKTPRYHMILPELRRVFPQAHFVFLLRNPLAVLASVIDTWAPDDCVHCLRPFRHDLALAPGHMAEAIRRRDGHSVVICYEDLAAEPAPAVALLCKHLRIPFEPAMLEYGRSEAGQAPFRFGDTGTVYRKSRPVASRIARWKKTLDSPIRRAWAHGYVQSLGGATVTALGYDFDELSAAFPSVAGLEGAWDEVVSAVKAG